MFVHEKSRVVWVCKCWNKWTKALICRHLNLKVKLLLSIIQQDRRSSVNLVISYPTRLVSK
jgi:hypothetical protein